MKHASASFVDAFFGNPRAVATRAPAADVEAAPNEGRLSTVGRRAFYWTTETGAHARWSDSRDTRDREGGPTGPPDCPPYGQPVAGAGPADVEHGTTTDVVGAGRVRSRFR